MPRLIITAGSLPGLTLLALRAGPMTTEQLNERFTRNVAPQLVEEGLATYCGEYYRITEAGRAAYPLRNPLAAPKAPLAIAEEPEMPRTNCINRPDVLKAIMETGAAGIQRAALIEKFGGQEAESAIANHLVHLKKAFAIVTPTRGHLVATEHYKPEQVVLPPTSKTSSPAPLSAPADQPQVSETTAAAGTTEMLPSAPAESKEVLVPVAPAAPARADSLASAIVTLANNDIVELETVDGLEIAIFNTGRLVMESEDGIVEMSKEVVEELRRYLGLFIGEAASV